MAKQHLLQDSPLGEDDLNFEADSLGFKTYADVLSGMLFSTPGPFTLGVLGDWGTGKTSLMRFIKRMLDDRKRESETGDQFHTIWVNAWRFENEQHPTYTKRELLCA